MGRGVGGGGDATAAGPVSALPAHQLARRQRIVDTALTLLETHEYERIQIRDVAAAADVALGTLYRYFSSKEHLYAAVLLLWVERGKARRRGGTREKSAEARVRGRVHSAIRAFERYPQFYKVHVQLQSSADRNAAPLMADFAADAQAMLGDELQSLGEQEARDAARMLWSVVATSLTHAIYLDGSMAEVHRLADRFVDLLADRLAVAHP